MVKASDVVYKYYEVEFAVKHKKDGSKASFVEVSIGYEHDGVRYYFQKNIQGDVARIFNANGYLVARYVYDAWGNHTVYDVNGNINTDENFIGNINPFRYRGYYYDVETGLYYLNTRYYDPFACRFINADDISYIEPETINGLNLYSYCGNNPIMFTDPTGSSFLVGMGIAALIGAIVGAISYTIAEGISYVLTGEFSWSWSQFIGSILGGAIGGAVSFLPGANIMLSAGITGFASTSIGMILQNEFEGTNYSFAQIMIVSLINGLVSAGMAGLSDSIKIKGLNKGRNSYAAISKSINTKLHNGSISRISNKTFFKMLTYNMSGSLIGSGVNGTIDATDINDWLAKWVYKKLGV